jgi:Ca2+-binding RTX toxin-like protein
VGHDGHDVLIGGSGADTLKGGADNDIYYAETEDTIDDDSGFDTLMVKTGGIHTLSFDDIENLQAEEGVDGIHLIGNVGDNTLTGNDQDNTLDGGDGRDILRGGKGDDTYYADANDTVEDTGGTDTLMATRLGKYTLTNSGIEILKAADGVDGIHLVAAFGGSTLIGNGRDNTLEGGAGADIL